LLSVPIFNVFILPCPEFKSNVARIEYNEVDKEKKDVFFLFAKRFTDGISLFDTAFSNVFKSFYSSTFVTTVNR